MNIHRCANICVYMRSIWFIYDEHVYVSVHICYRRRIHVRTSSCMRIGVMYMFMC